jgi:hypothetical protein
MSENELKEMISSVAALLKKVEGNRWESHLKAHLIQVKVELERQLSGGV